MTVPRSLYANISFLFINLSVICFLGGLWLINHDYSYYIEWFIGGRRLCFDVSFFLDAWALLFLSTVFFISSNVVYYRRSYMANDPDADRFILLVFAFVVSMALLITSSNLVSLLLGWDGLGLVSYCLVIYYPTRKSSRAGMLTVISNRVGDIFILILIGWFGAVGDFTIPVWTSLSTTLSEGSSLPWLVVLAAITKRAQFPFSAWLPAAIAAPTPVSALVHSSTLVTAGVYLLIRFSGGLDSRVSVFLIFLSTFTMFISGLVANFEYDLKKIVALSTLSQLGVIIFSISLGFYDLAFFHLITHALFKAMLFLCAGVLIHGVGGSQDIRLTGGLIKNFPLVGVCLNLANLSLCGLPFISGFYSKDLIVETAAQGYWSQLIILVLFVSLGLTVSYSVRFVLLAFVRWNSGLVSLFSCDQDYLILKPICNLTLFALLSGASLRWLLFPFPTLVFLPINLKLLPLVIISMSVVIRLALRNKGLTVSHGENRLSWFVGRIGFLPFLSGQLLPNKFLENGSSYLRLRDQGWVEQATFFELRKITRVRVQFLNFVQSHSLKVHFLSYVLWAILLIIIFVCSYSLRLKRDTEDVKMINFILEQPLRVNPCFYNENVK